MKNECMVVIFLENDVAYSDRFFFSSLICFYFQKTFTFFHFLNISDDGCSLLNSFNIMTSSFLLLQTEACDFSELFKY